ncbi:MAG: sugar phosphate isomerase/epimerase family protein [Halobacteriales archaeon]
MALGYTTILYDAEATTEGIGDVGACRYDGIELSLGQVRAAGVGTVADLTAEHGLDVYCVMGDWLESADQVAAVADGAEVAADLGADFLGLLPPRRGLVDDDTLDGWLAEVCGAAAAAGVTPVLHHHGATHVEGPGEIAAWLDRGPDSLGLLFDTAHYYPYGDVLDGLERFHGEIDYVHLKDVDPPASFEDYTADLTAAEFNLDSVINYFRSFTDPGEGVIDFAAVRGSLPEVPVTIEVENQVHDPLVHAKRNRDYWTSL